MNFGVCALVTATLSAVLVGNGCLGQQQAVFSNCATQATTDLCNEQLGDNFYSVCEPIIPEYAVNCNMCIYSPCTITMVSNDTSSNGTSASGSVDDITCADETCVSDLCSSFALFTNNSLGLSCEDLYDDQYCTYCEACYSFSDFNSTCGTGYRTTFCRLMPEVLNPDCYADFGEVACDQCAEILGGQSQVCSRLTFGNLTDEQNATLCSIAGSCASLPPIFNCTSDQELDCRLCNYLMDRDACDFTPNSDSNSDELCSTVDGLFCSLVNTFSSCSDEVSSASCQLCNVEYSSCLMNANEIMTNNELNATLCGSQNATLCGSTVSLNYDTCSQDSDQSACDFCKATLPVCNYQESPTMISGNDTNVNCNSSDVINCGYDLTFFPCSIIYGMEYCAGCGIALDACGQPEYASDFVPPNLCDSDVYVSLCYDVINLDDCSAVLNEEICSFCLDVVNATCALPSNIDVGLDHLCSNDTHELCVNLLQGNEFCTENDCYICRRRGTLCTDSDTFFGDDDVFCDSSENLFCRVYGSNFTNCVSRFSSDHCRQCQLALISCPTLSLSDLTNFQTQIVCANSDSCTAVLGSDSTFCQQESYVNFCETCEGFESVCESFSGDSFIDSSCESSSALFCRAFALNLTSCISQFSQGFCTECQALLQFCPALPLSDFTSDQVDSACEIFDECDPFFSRPSLCQFEDFTYLCDLCNGFQGICDQAGSGLPPVCTSETGANCSLLYYYFPCYATSEEVSTCDYCGAVVDLCPNLSFDNSIVPEDICDTPAYVSSCSIIANDQSCEQVYGDVACSYCGVVIQQCPVLNYTRIVQALDESCDSDFTYCPAILESGDSCDQMFTVFDCAYCNVLSTYCPGRQMSLPNCSSDYDLFCGFIATLGDQCGRQPFSFLPSTCETCAQYNEECSNPELTDGTQLLNLCTISNLFVCGDLPVGPVCQHLIPEESFRCDYCFIVAAFCEEQLCANVDLMIECARLYENGTVPTTYSDSGSGQCLPCAVLSLLCNDSFVVSSTVAPSMSMTFSSFSLFPSSSIFSADLMSSSFDMFPSMSPSASFDLFSSPSAVIFTSFSPSVSFSVPFESSSVFQPFVSSSAIFPPPFVSSSAVVPPPSSTAVVVPTSSPSTTSASESTSTASSSEEAASTRSASEAASEPVSEGTAAVTPSTTSTTSTRESTSTSSSAMSRSISESSSTAPTRSSTPPDDLLTVDDLTDEERRNAVTLEFSGLTRANFLANLDAFVSSLESLLRNALQNRKRQASNDVQVRVIEESIMELSNGNLEFSLIAVSEGGEVVGANLLEETIQDNGATLAQEVGARSFAGVEEGLPDSLEDTTSSPSDGLSDGEVAAIVIVVLIVVIVALIAVAVGVYLFAVRNKRAKYYITNTNGSSKRNNGYVDERELTISQSMKEANTENVTVATVVKNQNATDSEKDELKKFYENQEDKVMESSLVEAAKKRDKPDKDSSSDTDSRSDSSSTKETDLLKPEESKPKSDEENTNF